ncbi:MAG: LeuA family protein [Pirellulaceae bacterium]
MLSSTLRQLERIVIWHHKRRQHLFLSDTTLRDGEQMPGIRLNPAEKVLIAKALADAGIHSIDAGSPAASAEEIQAVRQIVQEVKGPVITAHCRTLAADIDRVAEAFQEARPYKKSVTLFIGVSPIHRQRKHNKSKSEIVRMSVEAIQYAKQYFRLVTFGPEDAGRAEPDYLHEIYQEAIQAGATTIGFADTVGILTPRKAADRIKQIQDSVPNMGHALLAVHFHNDLGLGTANALACVEAGVDIVQGTINGIGERAGNTPLEEIVMALRLHTDQYGVTCGVDPGKLKALSRLVARLTGFHPAANKPVVGDGLFVTESGVHQDGLLKDPASYLPFLPEEVGAEPIQLVLGKHSGRRAVHHLAERFGVPLDDAQVRVVVEHLKGTPARKAYRTEADFRELVAEAFPAHTAQGLLSATAAQSPSNTTDQRRTGDSLSPNAQSRDRAPDLVE